MTAQTLADLYALVEILGHSDGCHGVEHGPDCDEWCLTRCAPGDDGREECRVWFTARGLLNSGNLTRLLSKAWQRGFEAHSLAVSSELLRLLPRKAEMPNPYEEEK